MLDGLFAAFHSFERPVFDDKYTADQAIVSAEFIRQPKSSRLVIVFSPWHVPRDQFSKRISRKLAGTKNNVLTYYFNDQILSSNPVSVKNSFEFIALSIAQDVRALTKEYGYKRIDLFGVSLGNCSLCLTAEKLDKFDSVTLLVPGSELAGALWSGGRTAKLRKALEAEHFALKNIQEEWKDLAPISHVETLSSHPVHIVLAKGDRFIPYNYGLQLAEALQRTNHKTTVVKTHFGHMATILSYHYGY